MSRSIAFLALGLLAATGCKSLVEERCEEICACEKCSDFGEEDCTIDTEGSLEVASAYGCEDEAEAYLECELESYVCVDDGYTLPDASCPTERNELFTCLNDASQRAPGPHSAF